MHTNTQSNIVHNSQDKWQIQIMAKID